MSSLGQNRQAGDKGSFVLGSLAGTQNKGKHAGAGGKRHSTQSQVTISCLVPRPEPNFRHRTHKLKRWPGLKEEGPCKATSNVDVYSTSISPVLPRRKQWRNSFRVQLRNGFGEHWVQLLKQWFNIIHKKYSRYCSMNKSHLKILLNKNISSQFSPLKHNL